jgi:hypothetical protein
MIPLDRPYFETYDEAYKFHALNGAATWPAPEYPICYLLARVAVWRQLIGFTPVCGAGLSGLPPCTPGPRRLA